MSYTRVLPRDLFNEAKLLKCLGKLSLAIHDGMAPYQFELEHDDCDGVAGFAIEQRTDDGGLYCTNLRLTLNGLTVALYTHYNSKDNYPLYYEWGDESDRVFDEKGNFTKEFTRFYTGVAT